MLPEQCGVRLALRAQIVTLGEPLPSLSCASISSVALRAKLRAPMAAWISQCGFCRLQLSPAIRPGEGHCHLSGCLQPAPQDSTGRTEDGTGLSHRSSPARVASHPGPSSNRGGPISTVALSMLAGRTPTRRDRILPTARLVHRFWRGGTRAQDVSGDGEGWARPFNYASRVASFLSNPLRSPRTQRSRTLAR